MRVVRRSPTAARTGSSSRAAVDSRSGTTVARASGTEVDVVSGTAVGGVPGTTVDGGSGTAAATTTRPAARTQRLRSDLVARFEEAEAAGTCLAPRTALEAQRLRHALRLGKIISPFPQVFARATYWDERKESERHLHIVRALAQLHPDWVFCDVSAAMLYGLSVSRTLLNAVHIVTSPQAHSRSSGRLVRHVIGPEEIVDLGGVRVTSLERTAFDVVRRADFRSGLAVCDSALRVSRMRQRDLIASFARKNPHLEHKSKACAIAQLADGRAESGGESIARAVMLELGVMPPDLQVPVRDPVDGRTTYRADFGWMISNGVQVLGELDGREKYRNPEMTGGREAVDVLADERLRESHVSGTGSKILRFSYADVMNAGRFLHLLQTFGVPLGYPVPPVAQGLLD